MRHYRADINGNVARWSGGANVMQPDLRVKNSFAYHFREVVENLQNMLLQVYNLLLIFFRKKRLKRENTFFIRFELGFYHTPLTQPDWRIKSRPLIIFKSF